MQFLQKMSRIAARTTEFAVVAMGGVCMASLVWQVFTRYALGRASIWTEELALFLFTWIILLGGSLGMRDGFHVRLTLFLDSLPRQARVWAERVILALCLGLGVALAASGAAYVERTIGQVSAAVRYPIWLLNAAAPVAGALIVLHCLAALARPHSPGDPVHE